MLPRIGNYDAPHRTLTTPPTLATELFAVTLLFQHPKPINQAVRNQLAEKTQGLEKRREINCGMIFVVYSCGRKDIVANPNSNEEDR